MTIIDVVGTNRDLLSCSMYQCWHVQQKVVFACYHAHKNLFQFQVEPDASAGALLMGCKHSEFHVLLYVLLSSLLSCHSI